MQKIHLLFTILMATEAQRTFLDNFAYKGRAYKIFTDRLADQQRNTHQWNEAIKRVSADSHLNYHNFNDTIRIIAEGATDIQRVIAISMSNRVV